MASVMAQNRAAFDGQAVKLRPKGEVLSLRKYRDGAVRLRAVFTGKGGCTLSVRERGWQERYSARVEDAQTVSMHLVQGAATTRLRGITLPQPLVEGREYQLELRIVGARLSVSLNGALLDTRDHSAHVEPGRFGAVNYTESDQTVQALDFLDLDSPGAIVPAATTKAATFGPWQQLFAAEKWKLHPCI